MSLTSIRELITARTGLQPDSLGASAVPNAVDGRMRFLNVGTTEGYADRLGSDPQEFQALVDAIIVDLLLKVRFPFLNWWQGRHHKLFRISFLPQWTYQRQELGADQGAEQVR